MRQITDETIESYRISNVAIGGLNGKFCVFDLEGTGLDVYNDNVIQFGAVLVENGCIVRDRCFEMLVRPRTSIPAKIEGLTGITNGMVENAGDFKEAYRAFLDYSKGSVLVTQCGYEYDYRLLAAECARHDVAYASAGELDTKVLFAVMHPETMETISTDFLLGHYGIDAGTHKRHTGVGDAMIIAEIFLAMLGECRTKRIESLTIDEPLEIRKFVPKPL